MSDNSNLLGAEFDAEKRYENAIAKSFQELEEQGLSGRDIFTETEKRVAPLRVEYEQARFERMVEERDVKMLRRGTRRGLFIAFGFMLLWWSFRTAQESFTNTAGFYLEEESRWASHDEVNQFLIFAACFLCICGVSCFYTARQLGKIPLLGKEEEE